MENPIKMNESSSFALPMGLQQRPLASPEIPNRSVPKHPPSADECGHSKAWDAECDGQQFSWGRNDGGSIYPIIFGSFWKNMGYIWDNYLGEWVITTNQPQWDDLGDDPQMITGMVYSIGFTQWTSAFDRYLCYPKTLTSSPFDRY